MENESATSLYVQACKFLLCGEDRSSWDQLVAILPRLRNSLTCRVCRGLIVDPLSSGYCQHYVCRACLKRKKALNPGCKWCLDFSTLKQSDEQIRVVLACYKLLCEAINSSSYYVENDQNLAIANLLREAKLNLDVLPNSKFLDSIHSNNSQEMADNIASRDQLKTCEREKEDSTTAVNHGGKNIQSATNGILEHCNDEENNQLQPNAIQIRTGNMKYINCNNSNVAVNGQLQPSITKMETDNNTTNCNGTSSSAVTSVETTNANFQPNAIKIETENVQTDCSVQPDCNSDETHFIDSSGEINNNGTKTRLVSKANCKKVCLRPRNGQSVQKFEPRRHMRKRKLVMQTLNQKNRPRKKCKIGASK